MDSESRGIVQYLEPELMFRIVLAPADRIKGVPRDRRPDIERRRWIALGLLSLAQFVVVLDASIVNVALPSIGSALDFSQSNLAWVVNAYVLTFGGFLLLGGRMADLLGRRRVFMGGPDPVRARLARRRLRRRPRAS